MSAYGEEIVTGLLHAGTLFGDETRSVAHPTTPFKYMKDRIIDAGVL